MRNKKLFAIAMAESIMIAAGLYGLFTKAEAIRLQRCYEEMDKRELAYDADGWFIYGTTEYIGIYFADQRISVIESPDIDSGLYFLGKTIEIPETQYVPDGTPVLIKEKR